MHGVGVLERNSCRHCYAIFCNFQYETPLAQIKENRMNEKLKIVFAALFMVAGASFLAWTIYDTFFK